MIDGGAVDKGREELGGESTSFGCATSEVLPSEQKCETDSRLSSLALRVDVWGQVRTPA